MSVVLYSLLIKFASVAGLMACFMPSGKVFSRGWSKGEAICIREINLFFLFYFFYFLVDYC